MPANTVDPPASSRILTWPNLVTLVRLACIPVFLWLLFGRDDRLAAALLLAFIGATDWVDGYLARRLAQVSELGKLLDPTVDRLVMLVGVSAILVDGSVPLVVAVVTLAREGTVALLALVMGALGARRIDVTWWGKTGTFFLMFAFPLFLGGESDTALDTPFMVLAWLFVVPGLTISLYSAAQYVPLARRALRDGRAARLAS